MSEDYIAVGRNGAIATVRIDRPNAHNALNAEILRRLGDAIAALAETGEVRAIALTGTGDKVFCAGADLDELAGLSVDEATPLMRAGQEVIRSIEQCPVPVIAAVNGLALGGGFELVLACSFAVASTRAAFALPEARLGLIPGYGGTQRLARVVGPAVARHAMLTGHRFDAERAYHLGITVLPPAEPSDLIPTALELAGEVAGRGPLACRSILNAVDVGLDSTLDIGLALETRLAAMAIGGSESTEGVAAFKQRRTPEFGVKA
ncbi:enoyl-CoA hydratase/isomerase family protein [Streptomyces spiralis]|uniref:enoyl-CoA hydratase/isomerase family protein n=1 Tax=Streptomyces spiralis TaxID=66376 RepID=UPI0036C61D48